jgi:succinate dehydrogenase / fumarate reductase membrane anchor subunit
MTHAQTAGEAPAGGATAADPGGPELPAGRSVRVRAPLELYSWLFFRVSGVLLIFLALGHFALMHVVHSILEVDYAFAARRWAVPAWRVYDWLLLVLALLHGFNGLRVVVDEHVRPAGVRRAAQGVVFAATAVFLALGTYVVIAFRGPTA